MKTEVTENGCLWLYILDNLLCFMDGEVGDRRAGYGEYHVDNDKFTIVVLLQTFEVAGINDIGEAAPRGPENHAVGLYRVHVPDGVEFTKHGMWWEAEVPYEDER